VAAVILPFAFAPGQPARSPAQDPALPLQGAMTLDLDGTPSPLPAASFPTDAAAPSPRRVPADAILAIGRGIRNAASLPESAPAAAARRRMPRKHKLMLLTAAAVLYSGGMEARRHFKPRAVLIEVPSARTNAIAALPLRMPGA
jgi:hypothetical protein